MDPSPGLLNRALQRLLTREAEITAIEPLAPRFKLIELTPTVPQPTPWSAGMKLQIALGSVLSMRTYTPIEVDPASGRLRILAYSHGSGPGSQWIEAARPGDRCHLFGPRRSLDLDGLAGAVTLVGDETSIGLSCAVVAQRPDLRVSHLFESGDLAATRTVLDRLGLAADVLKRGTPAVLERAVAARNVEGMRFVLTGQASTIQGLRKAMRTWPVPGDRVLAKAYWAPGKTGMD